MKIRYDFVSNSSSSSFVLCGKVFDVDDAIKQILKENKELYEQYQNNEIGWYDIVDDLMYDKFGNIEFETVGYDGDIDEVVLGLSPHSMKNEQTLGEFKEQCAKALQDVGLKCSANEIRFISGGSDAGGCSFIESCG